MKDNHSKRRMVVNKFNNRPPFDLKKQNCNMPSGDEHDQGYSSCCNDVGKKNVNSVRKSYNNVVKYLEELDDKMQKSIKNKNKNVIPKVIQSFQKVAPKAYTKALKNKRKIDLNADISLHTLYRHSSQRLGKNIPNHKIMKNLLQDFEKVDIHDYPNVDVIPSRDIEPGFQVSIATKTAGNHHGFRIDKKTSTSGLVWPTFADPAVEKNPSQSNQAKSHLPRKKCSQKKLEVIKNPNKQSNVENKSSGLQYFPTKDVQELSTKDVNKFNVLNFPTHKFDTRDENFRKQCTYIIDTDKDRSNSKRKIPQTRKEKSFVQMQVEKINKINSAKNNQRKNAKSPNRSKKHNDQIEKIQANRKKINKNYIELMSTVKENFPKLEAAKNQFNHENCDWSDNVIDETPVKFPKETRNAMETLLQNSGKTPLTKYVKSHHMRIHPAISIGSNLEMENYEKPCYDNSVRTQNQLPCSKNLLCKKGAHDGPCNKPEKGPGFRHKTKKNVKSNKYLT